MIINPYVLQYVPGHNSNNDNTVTFSEFNLKIISNYYQFLGIKLTENQFLTDMSILYKRGSKIMFFRISNYLHQNRKYISISVNY